MLCGYGQMGKMLQSLIDEDPQLELVKVIDVDNIDELGAGADFGADVVIDFSNPAVFAQLSDYIERTGTPLVSGTTGYGDSGALLKSLGRFAPVVYSENFSVGISVLSAAVAQLSALLGSAFDVEISETHHNLKKDAPSGTAQLLIRSLGRDGQVVYGRSPADGPRQAGDIGVHSLRGGTVPGDHTVSFFGADEVVEVSHRAYSRRIFAAGALLAAKRLQGKRAGDYSFDQLLQEGAK